jgi:hypothetical protein
MSTLESSTIICTVDVVLLTLGDDALQVLLLRRDREPFTPQKSASRLIESRGSAASSLVCWNSGHC